MKSQNYSNVNGQAVNPFAGSNFNAPTADEYINSDNYEPFYEDEELDEGKDDLYPVESEYVYIYEDEVESVEIVETFGEDFYEKTEQRHIYAGFNYDDVMNAATALAELP